MQFCPNIAISFISIIILIDSVIKVKKIGRRIVIPSSLIIALLNIGYLLYANYQISDFDNYNIMKILERPYNIYYDPVLVINLLFLLIYGFFMIRNYRCKKALSSRKES